MALCNSIDIRRTLSSLIPAGWLEETARKVKFIQRDRKIDPWAFVWTLVLGFGVSKSRSFSALRRVYQVETGTTLVPSAFYDRFTEGLVRLLRAVLVRMLEKAAEPSRALKGKLAAFADVVTTDATVLRLHDMLAKVYAGCRTNHSKAAAKLHVVMSVLGRGPRTVLVTSERHKEGKKFRIGPWVKGRLLLFDLGYYCYRLFGAIARHGGYFISRMKCNANPTVVSVNGKVRGARTMPGQSLQSILWRFRGPVLDVQAKVRFKKRAYRGKQRWTEAVYRVVAVRDEETGEYHVYVTDVPPELLSAEDVVKTYKVRWEIEILFRQLKGDFRIDQFPTSKKNAVEALIYAATITLVVSRTFLLLLRRRYGALADRIPHERWAAVFAALSSFILEQLLAGRRRSKRRRQDILDVMLKEMIDPNRGRAGGLLGPLETVNA